MTTPLAALLADRIRAGGPMTLADYMADCLMHPEHGYYVGRDPFGSRGDFVTAPEISQMFGELIGICLAQAWIDQGKPPHIRIVELGPGRGTLMADLWRATTHVPGFHASATVHLVEISPILRGLQRGRVRHAQWHDRLDQVPEGPLFLIANEFFDALPIRQFVRDGTVWRERVVGLDRDGRLQLGLSQPAPVPALAHRTRDTAQGEVVELCPAAAPIAADIGWRIAQAGGAAIIADYGDWRSKGDTFQALAGHKPVDPLAAPGQADLTAHVDFEVIARSAAPAVATPVRPQGVFLERLGITARARTLARRLTGAALESHVAAHRRLTHPEEMGHLFKVIGFHPRDAPPPPGLET